MSGLQSVHWLYYTVPTQLSFNVDQSVASILSDIPFVATGIFGIGAFTFFMYLGQVDRLCIFLFTSVLLAFIGAIFDLAQLLARGQTATNFGQEMGSVAGLIDAREVCFAVSIAFRLLFFWALSSRRQLGELIADGKDVNSASWTRFGVVGRLVQWLLLLVVIGVLVLQAIWRLVPSQSNFSMTYGASAAAEIVLSTILAAKLLWNCGKTTIKPRMSLARRYSLPALALFMGMGMAIGNIIYFPFSETTAGRFLQAVGLYLLILWSLADGYQRATTYAPMARLPDEPPPVIPVSIPRQSTLCLDMNVSSQQEPRASIDYTQSHRESRTFPTTHAEVSHVVPSPTSPEARLPYAIHTNLHLTVEDRQKPARRSFLSRTSLTSWLSGRVSRARVPYGADDERLWTQDQAELGESPVMVEKPELRISEEEPRADQQERANWLDPMFASVLTASPDDIDGPSVLGGVRPFQIPVVHTPSGEDEEFLQPPPAAVPAVRRSRGSSLSALSTFEWNISVQPPDTSRTDAFPSMPISRVQTFLSFGTDTSQSPVQGPGASRARMSIELPPRRFSANGTDSPIYGLNGSRTAAPATLTATTERSFLRISSSSSLASGENGIEEVLARQRELDRSIQRLRLGAVTPSSYPGVVTPSGTQPGWQSASSDFSFEHLDQFPRPPWVRRSVQRGSPVLSRPQSSYFSPTADAASRRRSRSGGSTQLALPPPPPLVHQRQVSVPASLQDSVDSALDTVPGGRSDSQGTRYEITSFIGGLTRTNTASNDSMGRMSDDTGRSSLVVQTAQRSSAARPTLLTPSTSLSPTGPLVPARRSQPRPLEGTSSSPQRDTDRRTSEEDMPRKPSPTASRLPRGAFGLPSNPRPQPARKETLRPSSSASTVVLAKMLDQPRGSPTSSVRPAF